VTTDIVVQFEISFYDGASWF